MKGNPRRFCGGVQGSTSGVLGMCTARGRRGWQSKNTVGTGGKEDRLSRSLCDRVLVTRYLAEDTSWLKKNIGLAQDEGLGTPPTIATIVAGQALNTSIRIPTAVHPKEWPCVVCKPVAQVLALNDGRGTNRLVSKTAVGASYPLIFDTAVLSRSQPDSLSNGNYMSYRGGYRLYISWERLCAARWDEFKRYR